MGELSYTALTFTFVRSTQGAPTVLQETARTRENEFPIIDDNHPLNQREGDGVGSVRSMRA